jgi:hypothetical protein
VGGRTSLAEGSQQFGGAGRNGGAAIDFVEYIDMLPSSTSYTWGPRLVPGDCTCDRKRRTTCFIHMQVLYATIQE